MDLKTGRVRRKAIFGGDEDVSGASDIEDDEEMSEGDRLKNSSSDETEEEEDAEMTGKMYMVDKVVKWPRLEEMEEDIERDLLAFADSDDDLERSSEDEGEVEEADESSEEEGSSAEGEKVILELESTEKGSKPGLLQSNGLIDSLNLEKTMKKVTLAISGSGHYRNEDAFASEESSSLSTEKKDTENEEDIRKKFPKLSQVVSSRKLWSENLIDETSDTDLLKEEEDYKDENIYSTEISGM